MYGSEEYVEKRVDGNNVAQGYPIDTSYVRKRYLYYKGATLEFFNPTFYYRDYANADDQFVLEYTYKVLSK